MELLRGEDKEEVDDDKTVLSMVSHEKKTSYFPLNPGCLIGILTMVYYNPHITG